MTYSARVIRIDGPAAAEREMLGIKADPKGAKIMAAKAVFRAVKITGVPVTAANILKQDMLARGGEAATSAGTINHSVEVTDVILLGTLSQYTDLFVRLRSQQFRLPQIANEIEVALRAYDSVPGPVLGLEFGKKTHIMGILNVTPDSFSDGGMFRDAEEAVSFAVKMARDGAGIIDVGGESTRPGAETVDENVEIERTAPVIKAICRGAVAAPVSIDTRKASVAEAAIKAGAKMINDVSGLRYDPKMAETAAKYDVPVIIMHSKGDPESMQKDPKYDDLMTEVLKYFEESISLAVKAGVKEGALIIDPGIGFGKTLEHNIEILRRLEELRCLGRPVCIGTSRKSMIGRILGEEDPLKRDIGTAATIALAISKKVDIIRVHNTDFMAKIAKVSDTISRGAKR